MPALADMLPIRRLFDLPGAAVRFHDPLKDPAPAACAFVARPWWVWDSTGRGMTQDNGTSEHIYALLKAEVLTGSLPPHIRLDHVELAERFSVSTTPVREAAMRLLGEGLLEGVPKGGTRPIVASEMRLRQLLDFHANLSLAVVDWRIDVVGAPDQSEARYEERTRAFFRSLAQSTTNLELVHVVERLSDQLAPFRHREERLIHDASAELMALYSSRPSPIHLRRLLRSYHRRRVALVAQLVWMTNSDSESKS